MYDVFAELATDDNLENNGAWFPLGAGRVLVARAGNKAFAKALAKAVETNQVALDVGDDAADTLSDSIMVDVMARTILLGWENLGFKGQVLGVNQDNARTMLAVKEFRKRIAGFSNSFDAYKLKQETVQGNA